MTEQRQVPDATFSSYYGRPILKVTRWKEPHLPAYLFLGELSGAASVLGALAAVTGRRRLARAGRLAAAAGAYAGGAFLTAELGRPERFLHMLRVAKPTSPMSMGAWLLAAHSGLVTAAAASEVTGRLPRPGAAAGAAAALTGPLLAAYPAVLLADTAVPAWHAAYRQLPVMFAGGAMTAAAAAGLAAGCLPGGRDEVGPAARLALFGAVLESTAGFSLEHTLGQAGQPYSDGRAGRTLRTARLLTLSGCGVALAARRSRAACAASAALLAGGSMWGKFAVLRAGVASAADPKYVVDSQRHNGSGPPGRAWPADGGCPG
jgi:formate-dependent nitrite reductase membrane component NrfD